MFLFVFDRVENIGKGENAGYQYFFFFFFFPFFFHNVSKWPLHYGHENQGMFGKPHVKDRTGGYDQLAFLTKEKHF